MFNKTTVLELALRPIAEKHRLEVFHILKKAAQTGSQHPLLSDGQVGPTAPYQHPNYHPPASPQAHMGPQLSRGRIEVGSLWLREESKIHITEAPQPSLGRRTKENPL